MSTIASPRADSRTLQNAYMDILTTHEDGLEAIELFKRSIGARVTSGNVVLLDLSVGIQGGGLAASRIIVEFENLLTKKVEAFLQKGGQPSALAEIFRPDDEEGKKLFILNLERGQKQLCLNAQSAFRV